MNTLNKSVGDTITIKHSAQSVQYDEIFAVIKSIEELREDKYAKNFLIGAYDLKAKRDIHIILHIFKKPIMGGMMVGRLSIIDMENLVSRDEIIRDVWEIK